MKDKTDSEILDGSPVVVSFDGVEYTWRQKPRRQQRKVRNELANVAGIVFGMGSTDKPSEQVSLSVEVVNAILDFCEDNHPGMADDIEHIEHRIQRGGMESIGSLIQDVFIPIYQAWLEPWIAGDDSEETEKKST